METTTKTTTERKSKARCCPGRRPRRPRGTPCEPRAEPCLPRRKREARTWKHCARPCVLWLLLHLLLPPLVSLTSPPPLAVVRRQERREETALARMQQRQGRGRLLLWSTTSSAPTQRRSLRPRRARRVAGGNTRTSPAPGTTAAVAGRQTQARTSEFAQAQKTRPLQHPARPRRRRHPPSRWAESQQRCGLVVMGRLRGQRMMVGVDAECGGALSVAVGRDLCSALAESSCQLSTQTNTVATAPG